MKKRDVRLSTVAHREAFDGFYDAFRDVGHREGWRSSEVLRHFLEASFLALRGRTMIGSAWRRNEDEFLKAEGRWRDPAKTKADLGKMLGAVALAMLREPSDFIGPVFNEIAADSGMGQFFTPPDLSYLMAKMTLGATREDVLQGKEFVSLQEPACGVGGMILATCKALREVGLDCAREVHWIAVDVDVRAFHACYVQLALSDVSADVIHGNTLSLDAWGGATTPAALAFPKVFGSSPPPPPAAPSNPQLSLF